VTTEFAYFEPGPTRNPHNPEHTPGGSSSGSAAAVASGLCQLALGTQTIGSVIRPAAFCGIMGVKPSYGRVPTDGLIFFSRSADHVGFFTQDIEGLHLAASILCADWNQDMITQFHPKQLPVLGIPDGPYLRQASKEGLTVFEQQLAHLEKQGCTIKRIVAFDDIQAINHRHRQLTSAEAAQEHTEWFAKYQHLYRPKTEEVILAGQQISEAVVRTYKEKQIQLREHITQLQQNYNIDLWLSPSAPGDAPEGHDSTGNPIMNLPWTHAGTPAMTIPAGRSTRGLPLGLQLTGSFMQDELVLAWAPIIQQLLTCYQ
jgi:Asp-tRNA(Asn)/Glu-tRNA(Gln) amidotransferase A subunit family amidase